MTTSELPLTTTTDHAIAIKLIGIGGAGSNAVDRLKMENLAQLQIANINTDYQALSNSPVQEKVLIGASVTRGLGAGGDPEPGREAAESDREKIAALVAGADLVFLAAGMGGGTGGGAAPIVAEIATEAGALVIAFVTMPFSFEGGRRAKQAEESLAALRRTCDAVIPLPNDILLQQAAEGETALDSFARADAWIGHGVRSIWSMLNRAGLINLDFSSLQRAFHTRGGKTLFSLGAGEGENAVADTIETLKMCPLMHAPEFSRKADRLLVNIVGGTDLTLPKVNELMTAITEIYGRDSHIIMGAVMDETLQNRIEVCILGTTDFGPRGVRPPPRGPASLMKNEKWRMKNDQPAAGAADSAGTSGPARTYSASGVFGGSGGTTTTAPDAAGASSATGAASPHSTLSIHHSTLGGGSAAAAAPVNQDEFTFAGEEQRGTFGKTDRNLFEGQDLDVPTYLRKGIKITL